VARICCGLTYLRAGGVSDADAKDASVYVDEVEGLMPKLEDDAKPGVEEQLKEEKKMTKKLNARIAVLEAAAQKNAAALALGVKCAKQLLSECVCVCVCLLIYQCVCVCILKCVNRSRRDPGRLTGRTCCESEDR